MKEFLQKLNPSPFNNLRNQSNIWGSGSQGGGFSWLKISTQSIEFEYLYFIINITGQFKVSYYTEILLYIISICI